MQIKDLLSWCSLNLFQTTDGRCAYVDHTNLIGVMWKGKKKEKLFCLDAIPHLTAPKFVLCWISKVVDRAEPETGLNLLKAKACWHRYINHALSTCADALPYHKSKSGVWTAPLCDLIGQLGWLLYTTSAFSLSEVTAGSGSVCNCVPLFKCQRATMLLL